MSGINDIPYLQRKIFDLERMVQQLKVDIGNIPSSSTTVTTSVSSSDPVMDLLIQSISVDTLLTKDIISVGPITINDGVTVTVSDGVTWTINSDRSVSGRGAPQFTPAFVGQVYVDEATGNSYIAAGTSGAYNWGFAGRGSLSSFTKTTIPGLVAWYETDVIQTDSGANVTQWTDQSDSLYHLNAFYRAGTTYPILTANVQNGNPGVYFDGTHTVKRESLGLSLTQPYSMCVVMKPTLVNSAIHYTIGVNGSFGAGIAIHSTNTFSSYASGYATSAPINQNSSYITYAGFNGVATRHRVNATRYDGLNSGGGTAISEITLGADYNDGQRYTGYIMAAFIFNTKLSDENEDLLFTYLNNKYAVY
jgi:hypothetical protein